MRTTAGQGPAPDTETAPAVPSRDAPARRLEEVGRAAGNRALARLLNPRPPLHDAELLRFRTTLFAPLRNFEPSSGSGRFDAQLDPLRGILQITLRVRFAFISGRRPGDDPFPGVPGTDPSEFVWTPAEQDRYKRRFLTEIAPQWSGRFAFVSTRAPARVWQDVTVTPVVTIVEDEQSPHAVLSVHRRPDDAEPVTNTVTPRDPANGAQPLETSFTSDALNPEGELDDPAADGRVPFTKVHFARGSAELDERGTQELAPAIARLLAEPASHLTLKGHASSDRRAGVSVQQGLRDNLELSRARSRAVAAAVRSAGIGADRIIVRNWGDSGATMDADNCRVDAIVGTHEVRQGAAHEVGHLLGLGDEYGYDDLPGARPGDPLKNKDYTKMVKEQTGLDLHRTSDESMMSKGATIRPWHYSPFLEALKRIDGPSWRLPVPSGP